MQRIHVVIATGLLCLVAPAFAQDAGPTPPAVDPQAMQALDRMGKALRGLSQFEVTADSTSEVVLEDGRKIELGGTVDYKVRRPNGLFAKLKSDRRDREFYYDGKTLTIYSPSTQFYATLPAPDTIGGLVQKAQDDYGLEMPLADLFWWGTEKAPKTEIKSATYVGPAFLHGEPVAQYVFRQGDVDWQVWLDKQDMPRKLVIVDNTASERPEFTATLDWKPTATFADDTFAFKPSNDAYEILFFPGTLVAQEGTK
ncbi:DUF2092 domain-containing protein [Lysobacter sp. KIS68-7]|uniref:DUF2092 domain-containing protein n=1 Tax=Lysobacter sp. KIS68-7 TaxID=2904252 RepID=UPI001E4818EF|nr:DUF2092 domain-containing protein [Lysobacter sp. KIS68-7]UHQ18886.1 DUF2092 domain-containing protein [Lysobacter sp. KIS68-7]